MNTALQAIKELEAAGKLHVQRGGFNTKTRQNKPNIYFGIGYQKKRRTKPPPF